MDLCHHMFLLSLNNRLYLAPLKKDIKAGSVFQCRKDLYPIKF
jgi:hypothetical protein